MYTTAFALLAFSYRGQKRSSAKATPLALLKSMHPLKPSSVTRSNSVSDAAASFSGNVASAAKRSERSEAISSSASFTLLAN